MAVVKTVLCFALSKVSPHSSAQPQIATYIKLYNGAHQHQTTTATFPAPQEPRARKALWTLALAARSFFFEARAPLQYYLFIPRPLRETYMFLPCSSLRLTSLPRNRSRSSRRPSPCSTRTAMVPSPPRSSARCVPIYYPPPQTPIRILLK